MVESLKKEQKDMAKKAALTQNKIKDLEKQVQVCKKRKLTKKKTKKKKEKKMRKLQQVTSGAGPTPYVITMPPQPSLQPPPPMTAMEVQSRRPHYVSPIYSARNYAR